MKASTIISGALAALLLCAAVTAAAAQDRPSAVNPKGCTPHDLQTDGKAPDGNAGGTLSDKLARSGGVICPPNVDPEIKAPTPESGAKMPVIPPPGSPGGDPSIQPK
jgi:hypothetical protein